MCSAAAHARMGEGGMTSTSFTLPVLLFWEGVQVQVFPLFLCYNLQLQAEKPLHGDRLTSHMCVFTVCFFRHLEEKL